MAHYDCPDCGTFGCLGECIDQEELARREAYKRQRKIDAANKVLRDELHRRREIDKARQLLIDEDEWDDRYNCLFEE